MISIDCFIFNSRINYLLHIPLTFSFQLDIYHLYSIPIFGQSQFQTIIPREKFLLKNELYYAFTGMPCMEIRQQQLLCKKHELYEIQATSPCEIHVLDSKNTSKCETTILQISRSIINQLDQSSLWIGVFPTYQTVELKCPNQDESTNLLGTFLIEIPINCTFKSNDETISNVQTYISNIHPLLFPKLTLGDRDHEKIPDALQLHIKLDDVNLDDLQSLKSQITANQPDLSFDSVTYVPSFWTILLYSILGAILFALIWKKFIGLPSKKGPPPEQPNCGSEEINLSTVQLPH